MQSRRGFLNNAMLLVGSAVADGGAGFALAVPGPVVDPGALSGKLTLSDGTVKTFSGAQGVDLGDFNVPFAKIVQRNVMTRDPSGLFSVYFRPDRNGSRVEVVVLYGDPANSSPATLGPYTFEIFASGRSLQKIDVPYHFWLARWRWQSSIRPPVRKPADLIAAKLTPPYGVTSIAKPNLPAKADPYTIMGISSITPFMGQTGERFEIGQNPEYHSAYMATEDEGAYASMMEWAEASATGPWHINDPRTHKIINWDNWPSANVFDKIHSNPPIYVMKDGEKDEKHKRLYPNFLRPDDAHHPCTSYIPFITTGDPFHAEELQYQINFYLGGEHGNRGPKTYIFDSAQTRGFAWMMRSVLDNVLASGLIQSQTLVPKAFWKKVLDANLAYITDNFVHATDGKAHDFSSGTSQTAMAWWQEDYLCAVIGSAVQLGFVEWLPALRWKVKTDINRLNGTSGWNPGFPTLYFAQYVKQTQRPAPNNKGNGAIQFIPLSARGSQYPYLGEWQLQFTSPTDFNIVAQSGARPKGTVTSGTVGKRITSGYVPAFKVDQGNSPFSAGDTIYWTFSRITDWKELWDVNLAMGSVKDADPDSLPNAATDYMYSLYAAMVLAAPNIPEAAAILPGFIAKMKTGGAKLTWRNSFVLQK